MPLLLIKKKDYRRVSIWTVNTLAVCEVILRCHRQVDRKYTRNLDHVHFEIHGQMSCVSNFICVHFEMLNNLKKMLILKWTVMVAIRQSLPLKICVDLWIVVHDQQNFVRPLTTGQAFSLSYSGPHGFGQHWVLDFEILRSHGFIKKWGPSCPSFFIFVSHPFSLRKFDVRWRKHHPWIM